MSQSLLLTAKDTSARINLQGAEPVSWVVGGKERLWQADPAFWDRSAPLLFPVVGACRNGRISVEGRDYPMPLHGFAKDSVFKVMSRTEDFVHLRLNDDGTSRAIFPFAFQLDVHVTLTVTGLSFSCAVFNSGTTPLPYALGFHPGFIWSPGEGTIVFSEIERNVVPCLAPGGLLARRTRHVPMEENFLPLNDGLFDSGALVFLDAQSRELGLHAADQECIRLRGEGVRHLAVWSRPGAPFVAVEAWTGHADWEDFSGAFEERDSMNLLPPGQGETFSVCLEVAGN